MVDFGPRLPGSEAHHQFIRWLKREFRKAGLSVRKPRKVYDVTHWEAKQFSLDVLDGPQAGPVKVATYYVRSQETGAEGISAPLVYGGTGAAGSLSGASGSIVVVDVTAPPPATAGIFLPQATYKYWPGHDDADWATIDYKRSWIAPGLGVPLAPFEAAGAKAVVFILSNISYDALKGAYLPFTSGFEPIPALFVDRDTGEALRQQAVAGQQARFVLTADRREARMSSVTAVLPGQSKETIIFNTHTDGQNFAEENGGVAFVQLARHFASLPPKKRLKRTLVFAAWPGHMYGEVEHGEAGEAEGWIEAHPSLVKRAAAALTVEHLGCTEWLDTADQGYHATGDNEVFGAYVTDGKMSELAAEGIVKHDLSKTALLRPPPQFGVGGAFGSAGVPQIGAIAGPTYLVTISPNGEMDKLDEFLAARQIAWIADLARQIDGVPADELRS
jgi:hypothetical protein